MYVSTTELASRWKRLGGVLIDSFIAIIVTLPVVFSMVPLDQVARTGQMPLELHVFILLFNIALLLAIHGYLLTRYGQTVGKLLVGTRIVNYENGQLLPFGKVVGLRYILIMIISQIPFIGGIFSLLDGLFIFRQDKRCIHDLIAGSKVVEA